MALFASFLLNLFVTSVSAKTFYNTPEAANITLFNAVISSVSQSDSRLNYL